MNRELLGEQSGMDIPQRRSPENGTEVLMGSRNSKRDGTRSTVEKEKSKR